LGAPEEQPARPARELRPHPRTIVVVVGGPIAPGGIAALCERVRVLLEGSPADQVVCDVSALVDPDAVSVEALARLQLTARRLGRRIRLRHACGELKELLSLMGLREVLGLVPESGLEPKGQAEEREQRLGIQEEGDPADPAG
jgi:ABC-type transporter Mla MlaB component